jgi:RecB family endonuclease NucS
MTILYSLKQIGDFWEFEKESDFEDFLWHNLEELLELKPLKKQYYVKGQYCDILAIGKNRELIILELKISEDRYVVQQLTRYYHSLLEEKPFFDQIDYAQPVHLIAILPSIHRDNLIDCKYHQLDIKLITFSMRREQEKTYFRFKQYGTDYLYSEVEIKTQDNFLEVDVPKIPSKLKQIISKASEDETQSILKTRSKIFGLHKNITENIISGGVIYGLGKTKPIAEIRFDTRRGKPVLFLWLPFSSSSVINLNSRRTILRLRIWTDWKTVSHLGYIRTGNGVMLTPEEYKTFPINLIPASLLPFKRSSDSNLQFRKNHITVGGKRANYQHNLDAFEQYQVFRNQYTNEILDIFTWIRRDVYYQKHGEALALSVQDYINLITNRKKRHCELLLSNILDLSKAEFTLENFIELAFYERLLSKKNNTE